MLRLGKDNKKMVDIVYFRLILRPRYCIPYIMVLNCGENTKGDIMYYGYFAIQDSDYANGFRVAGALAEMSKSILNDEMHKAQIYYLQSGERVLGASIISEKKRMEMIDSGNSLSTLFRWLYAY